MPGKRRTPDYPVSTPLFADSLILPKDLDMDAAAAEVVSLRSFTTSVFFCISSVAFEESASILFFNVCSLLDMEEPHE